MPGSAKASAALFDLRRSLAAVLASDPYFITHVAGAEAAKACATTHELFCAVLRHDLLERPVLGRIEVAIDYVRLRCGHLPVEQVQVLYLDSKHHLLHEVSFRGTIDSASMDPREIMTRALEVGAAGLILAHNHPSGVAEPSTADRLGTRRVADAGRALGVTVFDHLIVTRSAHFSFREANLL